MSLAVLRKNSLPGTAADTRGVKQWHVRARRWPARRAKCSEATAVGKTRYLLPARHCADAGRAASWEKDGGWVSNTGAGPLTAIAVRGRARITESGSGRRSEG